MGFFKRFKKENATRESILEKDYQFDKSDFSNLLAATVAQSMIIQERVVTLVVKNQDWLVDFNEEMITFGDTSYPVQFLGTESYVSDTFLWGWKNINNYPESVLKVAHHIKDIGNEYDVDVLKMTSFELDSLYNGFNMSIVSVGLSKENYVYYKGPYDSGAAFLLFKDVDERVFETVDAMTFIRIINQCITSFPVDHKILVESFLLWNKSEYTWKDNIIEASIDKEIIEIKFEEINDSLRIESLKTKL